MPYLPFSPELIIVLVVILIIIIFLISRIKIVPQAQVYVIERLGTYSGTWATGIHFLVPFLIRKGAGGQGSIHT